MLKLSLLKPFTFYRSKTSIIAPVDMRRPKMNSLYAVLAPDVYSGLEWIADNDNVIRFQHLYRYFIEKYNSQKLYGAGLIRHDYGSELKISEFINELKDEPGQLKNMTYISYRSNYKGDMLKKYNVYYEINHIVQAILENQKDKRVMSKKVDEIISALSVALHGNLKLYNLEAYYNKVVFIPVNLWFDENESYSNLAIYRKTSKNFFGAFMGAIGTTEKFKTLFDGYTVVLVNLNEVMVLDPAAIPEKAKDGYVLDMVKLFMRRCKSTGYDIETEADSPEDEAELKQLEIESKKEDTTTKVIQNIIPDNAPVSTDTAKKIEDAVVAAAEEKSKKNNHPSVTQPTDQSKVVIKRISNTEEPEPEEDDTVEDSEEFSDNLLDSDQDPTASESPNDVILQARLSGQSIGNYQRNEMLKKRYAELRIDNRPIIDVIKSEKKYIIPDKKIKAKTVNPAYKDIKSQNFEKAYNDELFMHDLARILLHFSKANPALYLLNDPEIEDISTNIDKLYMVTVEYEDENRKRHKFKFKMPKMYQDKYMFINEQKWNIIHQKTPFPVTKMSTSEAQVVSNYNKIIMERYGLNISSRITKLKKILEGPKCPLGVKTTRGSNSQLNKNYLTTIEYDELGSKFSKITIGNLTIYFAVDDAKIVVPDTAAKNIVDKNIIPIAADRRSKKYYFLSGTSNTVYDQTGTAQGELCDWIINSITKIHPEFVDQFAGTTAGTKFTYTRARIMENAIPLIIVLAAADPGGLVAVLDKAKINYTFTNTRPKGLDLDKVGVYAFTDGYLIFDRYPYENSLLLNGLSVIPSKTYSWYDMGNRDTYVELFDLLYDSRKLIDGIENFYYLEIDPITEDVLTHLGLPTDFTKLMLYANGILADNTFDMDSAYDQSRIRSNEIILSYLYDLLCKAYAKFKRGDRFSIKEDALIKELLKSRIVESHSKLNIALELENDRQVKLKGPHGMNQDRAFTLEKRAYHPSMKGIIGMNSTPSGEVGINRHMSLNSNIIDARGFVRVNKDEYDGTELNTPGELLNPFDSESADPERVAMAISQSKHYVPTQKVIPSLVNYDMERIAPYLSNDYSVVSKHGGIVKEISNDVMIVQYDDGTFEDVDLSEHPDKNTDGGFYIMDQLVTDLKEGDRFEADEIIAYNPKYITAKDDFGDNLASTGALARVAIVMNGAVYEDACYLTDKLCDDLSTKITTDKTVHLSRFSNIKYIVKKGQHVQANDLLLSFDDTDDEFSSQMMQQLAEESPDDDDISATAAPVFSKVTGTVKDIKIYYSCDPELMSPSLRQLITDYNKEVGARHAVIEKYMDPKDANSIIPPATIVTPDSTGRVKGKKMPKEVMIEFYIEYTDKYGVGDKCSHMYALKGVASYIIPKGQEAFTEFNPERKIDAYLSAFGLFKRMVLSLEKEGGLTKILIEKKRLLKNKYLDRINDELKK